MESRPPEAPERERLEGGKSRTNCSGSISARRCCGFTGKRPTPNAERPTLNGRHKKRGNAKLYLWQHRLQYTTDKMSGGSTCPQARVSRSISASEFQAWLITK